MGAPEPLVFPFAEGLVLVAAIADLVEALDGLAAGHGLLLEQVRGDFEGAARTAFDELVDAGGEAVDGLRTALATDAEELTGAITTATTEVAEREAERADWFAEHEAQGS